MSQKGNYMNDSLEFVSVGRYNGKGHKGKTYAKTSEKKNKVKYFKINDTTEKRLLEYSNKANISQSAIIINALIEYLEKKV